MNKKTYCIFLSAAILLAACDLPLKQLDDAPEDDTTVVEDTSLFEPQDNGSYAFETNDTKYTSENGYTIWAVTQQISSADSFSDFTTSLVKSHGNTGYGFGVIFNGNTDSSGNTSMICVLIRTTGDYAIGKVENGLYDDIQYWESNSYIKTGLGVENTIKITKDTESDEYAVTFNGNSDSTVTFLD
ncbi:MAG TPA: hypothetical protein DCL73_01925, partial [Treponema sp.]|nr:hypothetical protein [Treponema sp.]